jgi:hypothetical protein
MIKPMPPVNKVNVYLRDGTLFLNKDIPSKPFDNRSIGFFDGALVTIIPMDLVSRVELFVENP